MSTASAVTESTTIKVVSHSMLFYWWPVWLVGFILALLSYVDGFRLAVVPDGTRIARVTEGTGGDVGDDIYGLAVPSGKMSDSLRHAVGAKVEQDAFPTRVSNSKTYGTVFVLLLLFVVLVTNVSLRGLWSVLVIMFIVMLVGIFAAEGWWAPILAKLGNLHIFITAPGYLVISLVLFLFWMLVVFLYDQRRFMIFSPGQFVVHREVGDMRQIHDTTNVTVEKRRSDLFRNWLLGFGSGDLIVQTPGTQGQEFTLPNVLFAARRVREIANLLKTRPVVPE